MRVRLNGEPLEVKDVNVTRDDKGCECSNTAE